jgi:Thiolase, C-terminal domain
VPSCLTYDCLLDARFLSFTLRQAGLTASDIDVFEINEAFASQALYCVRELGLDSTKVRVATQHVDTMPLRAKHAQAHSSSPLQR